MQRLGVGGRSSAQRSGSGSFGNAANLSSNSAGATDSPGYNPAGVGVQPAVASAIGKLTFSARLLCALCSLTD